MKPLLVNTYDRSGGAARAALRLHHGLRAIGVASRMLVQFRSGHEPGVIGTGKAGEIVGRFRARLDRLPVRLHPARQPGLFTPAAVPDGLAARVGAAGADLVHLHWVADGLMRIETLPRLRPPLVWTLHDSWAFTGGCHVPQECTRYRERCGACPALGSRRERDLSRRVWERKRDAWRNLPVRLVTPSRWLASCVRSSALLGTLRCDVIPNGVDLDVFRPAARAESRARFGLPSDRRLVLFGGVQGATDPNKGLSLLIEALRRLAADGRARDLECVAFGVSPGDPVPETPVPVRLLGQIATDLDLAALYAAADVLVVPSRQENLPNTVAEAMACAVPTVAFDAGGLPDLIEHERTGCLARPFDPGDLARAIAWVLEDGARARALGECARRKAEAELSITSVARRYADLYREVLAAARHSS